MSATEIETRIRPKKTRMDPELVSIIRDFVWHYVRRRGRQRTAEAFGVSRQTLWRYLEYGLEGSSLPSVVMRSVGGSIKGLEGAWRELIGDLPPPEVDPSVLPLPDGLEDTLFQVCAAPLATVEELSHFERVPASTIRDRLERLTGLGLVCSIPHRLSALGPRPQHRYIPTERGIMAGGMAEKGLSHFLGSYLCRGSGSACWSSVLTPWPCSTT